MCYSRNEKWGIICPRNALYFPLLFDSMELKKVLRRTPTTFIEIFTIFQWIFGTFCVYFLFIKKFLQNFYKNFRENGQNCWKNLVKEFETIVAKIFQKNVTYWVKRKKKTQKEMKNYQNKGYISFLFHHEKMMNIFMFSYELSFFIKYFFIFENLKNFWKKLKKNWKKLNIWKVFVMAKKNENE